MDVVMNSDVNFKWYEMNEVVVFVNEGLESDCNFFEDVGEFCCREFVEK